MINLMPPDTKSAIRYARLNSRLVKWTMSCCLIIILMLGTVFVGGWYIDNTKNSLSSSITQTKTTIAEQKLDQTRQEAESLSQGVKLIVQVLSKEVQFSKLLQQIGKLMPAGATLGDIQLSNKVTGAIDLTANAIDYQSATQVQVNLQDPKNNLFDKVDATSVTCSDTQSGGSNDVDSRYKCQILIKALFKKDAAVTFIGSKASGATQ